MSRILLCVCIAFSITSCTGLRKQTSGNNEVKIGDVPPVLERQPYLQMLRSTGVVLTWKTDQTAETASIAYYKPGSKDTLYASGVLIPHEGMIFNEVTLSNLEPETTYNYHIITNGYILAEGDAYQFTTVPDRRDAAFSFYALGDIGAKQPYSFANEPADRILKLDNLPDFGLGLGDIVYPKGESKNYDAHLFQPFEKVFRRIPFYPVAGNHDWLSKDHDANFKKEWHLPNNEHYYTFKYANSLFIGLDSRDGDFFELEKQTNWLEETLKTNQGKNDWTVVFLHHNGRSCTYKQDYDHVIGLYAILAKYNVDLVLNGHAHTYERLKPYDGMGSVEMNRENQRVYEDLENRFIAITIGAGGKINKQWEADPENPENCEDGSIVAHSEHVPSFGLVHINGKNLRFEAINSFTGEVFDQFTIFKSN